MRFLLHIIDAQDWSEVGKTYAPTSLALEGFIHCSTIDTVLIPANDRFHGQTGLKLLVIDTSNVDVPIRYEDCENEGVKFPHIYGPLLREAVVAVVDFPPHDDGSFQLPVEIHKHFT